MLEHSGMKWQALMDAAAIFADAGIAIGATMKQHDDEKIDRIIEQLTFLKQNGISSHNGQNIDISCMTEVFVTFVELCHRNSIDLEWLLDNCIEHYEMFFSAADMPARPENWPKPEPKSFDFRNAAGVAQAKQHLPPDVFDFAVTTFGCEKLVTSNDE